jgi:hypothetical protein
MKKYKIMFWVIAIIIFLFEGVMPALTSQTELAKEGIRHLGYPEYFGNMLVVFKVLGAIALVTPKVRGTVKEWVFAGFGIDFLSALISTLVVDGFTPMAILPAVFIILLVICYRSYHKMNSVQAAA